jgi:signal transduction histidine kinase
MGRAQEVNSTELSRSKAEQSLQRDRILTIINNLADAVLSTDKHGIIRVYNAASLNLLDTNQSLNSHHIGKVLTLRDANGDTVNPFDLLKNSNGVVVRDDLLMDIEGDTMRLELTMSPIRGAYSSTKRTTAHDGYVVILRDITKAKSLEEERDEFISVVSHELRTPITIAEGTISNVQLMLDRPNVAKSVLKNSITMAHEQVVFLAKMVNDLSTLSRAERGVADTPESINVRTLINDLYKEYAPQAAKKKLHFDLDLTTHLGSVTASPLYLKELLQNFITNALKYTKEGGITVRIERDGDNLTFAVKDTGIGISKTDQAKVFNKFYRSEDYRTRETGGTGLGLYVAAKLSKKLGTQISLTSRLNHGSTFSFSLPAEPTSK